MAKEDFRGMSFDRQLELSGFDRVSKSNPCMRLGDIAHESQWHEWAQNLFQNKINSAEHQGYRAYVIHEGDWHGYYESRTKECGMGICNCRKEAI